MTRIILHNETLGTKHVRDLHVENEESIFYDDILYYRTTRTNRAGWQIWSTEPDPWVATEVSIPQSVLSEFNSAVLRDTAHLSIQDYIDERLAIHEAMTGPNPVRSVTPIALLLSPTSYHALLECPDIRTIYGEDLIYRRGSWSLQVRVSTDWPDNQIGIVL